MLSQVRYGWDTMLIAYMTHPDLQSLPKLNESKLGIPKHEAQIGLEVAYTEMTMHFKSIF